jgi:hypothetical protein
MDDPNMIFRGVSDSKHLLIPSIGRQKYTQLTNLYDYEREVFENFKQKAHPYLSHEPRNEFEWLYLAQHYGIPTRLLDWTENPLVALYFMCEKEPEKEGAVYKYLLTNWFFNVVGSDPFWIRKIGGLRPPHKDVRYINQAGTFSIHPEVTEPLDDNGILKCVFSPEVKEIIRWQIHKLGIRATFIFPSLESVARDIVDENETILGGRTVRISGNLTEL